VFVCYIEVLLWHQSSPRRDELLHRASTLWKGSLNVPFLALLMPETGVFRTEDALCLHFAAAGVLNKARAVTYCGGGIAATLNAFALVLLGHPSVAVYDGGLDEWSREQELPMETGE
jgi:thiosulfate/3-mercaptopyruvate sulfurtransferase